MVAPVKGRYFENPSPVNGKPFCEVARSGAEDVELALDAARQADGRLQALGEATPSFLYMKDRESRMIWCNPAVPEALAPGAYRVEFRGASADGHVGGGTLRFRVGPAAK